MSNIGEREAKTQKRVIDFFTKKLKYDYLGNWKDCINDISARKCSSDPKRSS